MSALTAKWRDASEAARKSQHHWPADCLAEAVTAVEALTADLEFSRQTTTNVLTALAESGSETAAAEQVVANVRALTDTDVMMRAMFGMATDPNGILRLAAIAGSNAVAEALAAAPAEVTS